MLVLILTLNHTLTLNPESGIRHLGSEIASPATAGSQ